MSKFSKIVEDLNNLEEEERKDIEELFGAYCPNIEDCGKKIFEEDDDWLELSEKFEDAPDKDKENLFLISNLQSKFTEEKFPELRKIDSVAVIKKNGEIVQKSKAVNHILKSINRLILLRTILNILPLSISNFFYDIVAKSRYKVFGKYDSCQLPEPEYKSRFIA